MFIYTDSHQGGRLLQNKGAYFMPELSTQETVFANQESVKGKLSDLLDQMMKPEVQESLTVLFENLPKLTEMAILFIKTYDLVQNAATDRVLIEDFKGGMEEFIKPIQEKAKHYASAAIEANDRAREDSTKIGLFGLFKMWKDPQVQKMLRITQAFLDIMAERQHRR